MRISKDIRIVETTGSGYAGACERSFGASGIQRSLFANRAETNGRWIPEVQQKLCVPISASSLDRILNISREI